MEDEHNVKAKMIKIHLETAERLDQMRFASPHHKKFSYDTVIHIILDQHDNYETIGALVDIIREVKTGGSGFKHSLERLNDQVNKPI